MLYIEKLTKDYGKSAAIRGLTLSFPIGLHIIAGDNGAGKTTLFKCIAGLETYGGYITWGETSAKGHIATSFDDSPAHSGLTGLQNLSAMLDTPIRRLRGNQSSFAFLSSDRLAKKAKSYSLGQRRKLSLTALFMDAAPCALLDEPTSGLDGAGKKVLAAQLEAAARTRCVIVSDHYVDFYAGLGGTLYSFQKGTLHEEHVDALTSPKEAKG